MGCNMKFEIVDEVGEVCVIYKLGYGFKFFVKDGGKIGCGEKFFEWDLFILLILVEKDGKVKFVDFVLGIVVCDVIDEVIGMI